MDQQMSEFRIQLSLYLPFIVIGIITAAVLIYAVYAS